MDDQRVKIVRKGCLKACTQDQKCALEKADEMGTCSKFRANQSQLLP